jgi:hypothetical protein
MDAWELIKADRFRDAVDLLTAQLAERPATPLFNNRGMAHLHLGEFEQALSDFRAADETSAQTSGGECDGAMAGVALWVAGEHQHAASTWARGTEAMVAGVVRYTDAAGGVSIGNLLWFASVRLHDSANRSLATKLLRKKLRAKQSQAWPGPISRFLLGAIDESQLRGAVSHVPILRERESCEAEFYIGLSAFDSDPECYYASMRASAAFGSVARLGAEYYLAAYEASLERQSIVARR